MKKRKMSCAILYPARIFSAPQELLEQKAVRRDYCEILLKVNDLFGSAEALQQARKLVNNERSSRLWNGWRSCIRFCANTVWRSMFPLIWGF